MLRRFMFWHRGTAALLRGPGYWRAVRATAQPAVSGPRSRVRVSPTAGLADVLINTVCGHVDIGDYAFIGHGVMLLTGTHDFRATGPGRQRVPKRLDRGIVIEEGAWIASGATLVGPCRIGRNSVVSSGCVVDFDVPPDTLVRLRQDLTLEPIRYLASDQAAASGG